MRNVTSTLPFYGEENTIIDLVKVLVQHNYKIQISQFAISRFKLISSLKRTKIKKIENYLPRKLSKQKTTNYGNNSPNVIITRLV